MLIYLDNCCLQRPLDDHTQLRIAVEGECVIALMQLVETGRLEIASSEALLYEIGRTADSLRKAFALKSLARASVFVEATEQIETRASLLSQQGLTALDALHIACAEAAGARYFCTCDGRILRKADSLPDLSTTVIGPAQLITELES